METAEEIRSTADVHLQLLNFLGGVLRVTYFGESSYQVEGSYQVPCETMRDFIGIFSDRQQSTGTMTQFEADRYSLPDIR